VFKYCARFNKSLEHNYSRSTFTNNTPLLDRADVLRRHEGPTAAQGVDRCRGHDKPATSTSALAQSGHP
jgi:hypothetical protein